MGPVRQMYAKYERIREYLFNKSMSLHVINRNKVCVHTAHSKEMWAVSTYSISKWEKENQFLTSTMILIEWLIAVWSSLW